MLGIATLAIAGLATVASAEGIKQEVRVWKIEGNARYSTDNRTWHTLHKGDLVGNGAVIQTAEESSVDLILGDAQASSTPQVLVGPPQAATGQIGGAGLAAFSENGPKPNSIHLYENSVFSVDSLSKEYTGMDEVSDTQLNLRSGRILGNVKKLSAASRFEIKLPNGVAGIRGTLFTIGANGTVYCLSGSVVISYMVGSTPVSVTVNGPASFNPYGPGGVLNPNPPSTVNSSTPGSAIPPAVVTSLTTALHNQGIYNQTGNPATPFTPAGSTSTIHVSPQ